MSFIKNIVIQNLHFILIGLIGTAIYSNSFEIPFHFDDFGYIKSNIALRKLTDPLTFWKNLEVPQRLVGYYTFALNYYFHDFDVFGYHLVNFLIHLANAAFLWWLVILIMSLPKFQSHPLQPYRRHLALCACLLFLSHPLQTQAVTYISQRFASLAAFFYLSALCCYLKARSNQHKFSTWFFVLAAFCAILGMFTKQILITLPVMIFLMEGWLLGSWRKWRDSSRWLYGFYGLLIFSFILIIPAFYSFDVGRILSMKVESGSYRGDQLNSYSYLLTQFRVILTYLRLIFFPVGQNLLYDYPASSSFFEPKTFLSFSCLVLILGGAIKARRRYPLISLGVFWFFLTLCVESSIIVIKHVIFEHRVYLPLVGPCIAVSAGLRRGIRADKIFLFVVTAMVLFLSILTYQRNKDWLTEETLWRDVIQKSPRQAKAYLNLGNEFLAQGRIYSAITEFNKAIEADPQYERTYVNRGTAFAFLKQYNQAIADFKKAIELKPSNTEAYIDWGNVHGRLGQYDQAIERYNKALEFNPQSIEAHINRGNKYFKKKMYELAIQDYSKVIELDKRYAKAYQLRGSVYQQMGRYDQALQDYHLAIRFDPEEPGSYYARANVYAIKEQYELLLSDLDKALSLDPKNVKAYEKRGHVHLKLKEFDKALKDYNMVLSLKPQNAVVLYTRSLTYQGLGKFREALLDAQKAKALGHAVSNRYLQHLKTSQNRK